MEEGYAFLDYLRHLKQARQSMGGGIDTTQLEKDFLRFSCLSECGQLDVHLPAVYSLDGCKRKQMADAIKHIGLEAGEIETVDVSGQYDIQSFGSRMVILSPAQLSADHFSRTSSYLNPLIQEVYGKGGGVVSSFTISRALCGEVKCSAGVDLAEIKVFPEKFVRGKYTLSVSLDTTTQDISRLRDLEGKLKALSSNPKAGILNAQEVKELAKLAVSLRENLGALSRYTVPESTSFQAQADEAVVRYEKGEAFFFYSPEKNKNIAITFGETPLKGLKVNGLEILVGEESEKTMRELIDLGFFEPSEPVLKRRIGQLDAVYEEASRKAEMPLIEERPEFGKLLRGLKDSEEYFAKVPNFQRRREFVKQQNPVFVELMICPKENSPILHEILARLSWNTDLRAYNSTFEFIDRFKKAGEEEKAKILGRVCSSIAFDSQQNNDVNLWLYFNFRNFCQKQGIKFNIS